MMKVNQQVLTAIIYDAIDGLNRQLPRDAQLTKSPETVLAGAGGHLDSLGLITLLVSVEESLQAKLGIQLAVLDQEELSQAEGPYHTVSRLENYIVAKTNQKEGN